MFNQKMQRLGEQRSVIRELFEYGAGRKKIVGAQNVADLSIGNPGVPAPESVKAEISRLLKELPAEELHGYTSAPGLYETRRAVSDYIASNFKAESDPDLIYMTCGASASLAISLSALLLEGEEVIVLAPFFPEYRVFIENAGGKCVVVQTDSRFRLDLNALERAITNKTKAILLNSPNNPSGAVCTEEEIRGLAALLIKKNEGRPFPLFLISDEPYRELVYDRIVPYVPNFYEHTLVCYSFSKSLSLAGERVGYIAVSPRAAGAKDLFSAVMGAGRSLGYVCAPALFQRVVSRCMGDCSHLPAYRKNRDLLCAALKRFGYEFAEPEGAFYLFVKSPIGDAEEFSRRAQALDLLIVPSNSFGVEGYLRVSYCMAEEVVRASIPKFEKLIETLR